MSSAPAKRFLIMAGGTGGHVYPALATARALEGMGHSVEWLGSPRGIENRVVPEAGIKLHQIPVKGLRGKGVLTLIKAPFGIVSSVVAAVKVLRQVKPDAVLGMGGFASGPGGLAAKLLGIPLVIHEQNAVAGFTNRCLSRIATRTLEAFKGAFAAKPNVTSVGNPVRGAILDLPEPNVRFAERQGPLRVLVVGGSLGARALNVVMPELIDRLADKQPLDVWHQTGATTYDETLAAYGEGLESKPVKLVQFIENMHEAYGWADVVICRSGALTVSELAIAGLPAILVPFPHAVDDHQTANGRYLEQLGAAKVIDQSSLTVDALETLLMGEFGQREALLTMASKARDFGRPEASDAVAKVCLESIKA